MNLGTIKAVRTELIPTVDSQGEAERHIDFYSSRENGLILFDDHYITVE